MVGCCECLSVAEGEERREKEEEIMGWKEKKKAWSVKK